MGCQVGGAGVCVQHFIPGFEAMFGRLPIDCNMDNIDANQKLEVHGEARSHDTEDRAAKRQKMAKQ